ncbi:MAG TPA: hypothetical protein VMV84_01210 [Dehalococcoidales bacterium]|nr:hypothetical protein [Dehalococcoidales bacterium]
MGVFSGTLYSIVPTSIKVGLPIQLVVAYYVHTSSWWEVLNGWYARVEITLDGLGGVTPTHYIIGKEGRSFSDMITVGPDVMPGYDLNGFISIKCYKGDLSSDYEIVYYGPITIKVEGIPDDGEEPDEGKEFPIVAIALAAGALLVVTAAVTKKKK